MTAKICFFDIETSNLNANFGYILSFGWKFQGEKEASVISIADYPLFKRDPTNDKLLVKDIAEIMMGADVLVGHYSQRFDVPFINTRLLTHGFHPLPPIPHIDTWRICKYKMKLNSNRLDTVSKFLRVEHNKSPVDGIHWVRAMAGNKKSLQYVIKHNLLDVLVLEEVYNRIRSLTTVHPNLNIVSGKYESCPVCNAEGKLQKRGFNIARTTKTQRFQCKACGSWSRGRPQRIEEIDIR